MYPNCGAVEGGTGTYGTRSGAKQKREINRPGSGRISERDRSTDHQEHTLPLHDGLDYPIPQMGRAKDNIQHHRAGQLGPGKTEIIL